jgi:hypothetical protein
MHAAGELDAPQMSLEATAFSLALALGHWPSPPLPHQPILCRYAHSRIRHVKFWAQNALTTPPTPPLQPPYAADEASGPPLSAATPPASLSAYRSEPPLHSTDLRRSLDWPQFFYSACFQAPLPLVPSRKTKRNTPPAHRQPHRSPDEPDLRPSEVREIAGQGYQDSQPLVLPRRIRVQPPRGPQTPLSAGVATRNWTPYTTTAYRSQARH